MTELVRVSGLGRTLPSSGGRAQAILQDITFSIPAGQFVALTGPSGSGKSTLLYLLGALDRTSVGTIRISGVDLGALDEDERARFRNERLGFVFQFHFLLPEFTALENVVVPMMRRGVPRRLAEEKGHAVLAELGLAALHARRPGQLSGGEQQRVSIARAVANEPMLILADEPTGNLDTKNALNVMETLRSLTRARGCTVIMVTHDPRLSDAADRRIGLLDGRVVEDA